jgi:DNA polymerase III subunit epsilon
MPARIKPPVLPVYYYHDHFTEMLLFVSETYGAVLTECHRAFVRTFKARSQKTRSAF